MSNIILKRSSVPGKVPLTSDLELGEIAINTYDGDMFFKKNTNGTQVVIKVNVDSTTEVPEGTNLYYTVARANTAIDARVTKTFVDALGIDADLFDGVDSSNYARTDVDETFNGKLTISDRITSNRSLYVSSSVPGLMLRETDASQTTHNASYIVHNGNGLSFQVRDNTENVVNTAYNITYSSVGALAHDWRIGNINCVKIDSVGDLVVNNRLVMSANSIVMEHASSLIHLGEGGYVGPHGICFYQQDGNVGIQQVFRTSANKLYWESSSETNLMSVDLSGNLTIMGDCEATNFNTTSDMREKEDVESIENALEIVNSIDGVRFKFKGKEGRHVGVIAQNVEKFLPEAVNEREDGTKTVSYGNMVGVLIEAIKEQQKQIEELKSIVESN